MGGILTWNRSMRDSNSGLKRSGLILELTLAGFKLGIEVGRIPALIEVTELIPDLAVELGGAQPMVPRDPGAAGLASDPLHTGRAQSWRGDLRLPLRQQRRAAHVERQMGDAYLPQALRARECRDVGLGPTHSRGSQEADIIGAELG